MGEGRAARSGYEWAARLGEIVASSDERRGGGEVGREGGEGGEKGGESERVRRVEKAASSSVGRGWGKAARSPTPPRSSGTKWPAGGVRRGWGMQEVGTLRGQRLRQASGTNRLSEGEGRREGEGAAISDEYARGQGGGLDQRERRERKIEATFVFGARDLEGKVLKGKKRNFFPLKLEKSKERFMFLSFLSLFSLVETGCYSLAKTYPIAFSPLARRRRSQVLLPCFPLLTPLPSAMIVARRRSPPAEVPLLLALLPSGNVFRRRFSPSPVLLPSGDAPPSPSGSSPLWRCFSLSQWQFSSPGASPLQRILLLPVPINR